MQSDETVVRSTCPTCGTVDVAPSEVTVLITSEDVDPQYRYTCPGCAGVVQKPTSARAIPMLRSAGATVIYVPAEVTERAGTAAAALTEDDVDAFCYALEGSDDLARLASALPR